MVIKCVLYVKFSKVLSKIAAGLLIVSIIIRCLLCLVWCDTYMKASALKYVKVFYGSVYLSVCKNIGIIGCIPHNSSVSFTQQGMARFGFLGI